MSLHAVDWLIVALYTLFVVGVGAWSVRRQRSDRDYFLAGRSMPVLAVSVSIIATALSGASFLGAPEEAYNGDLTYLIGQIGEIIGLLVVAFVFVPAYYRANVKTVYELLEQRMDVGSRRLTSAMFMVGRIFASGARLYIASIAVAYIAFGSIAPGPVAVSIAIVAVCAALYTMAGGIAAVIWTDTAQLLIVVVAIGASAFVLLDRIPLGFGEIGDVLAASTTPDGGSKLRVVDTSFDLSKSFTLWGSIFGLSVFTAAAFGTDQDLVQRMLTCRSAARGTASVLIAKLIGFVPVAAFLTLGLLLYIFYNRPDVMGDALGVRSVDSRGLVLDFMLGELPVGLRGLIVAGLLAAAMSSLDSALNALASTAICDFYEPMNPRRTERGTVLMSRIMVGVFAYLLAAFAIACIWLQQRSDLGLLPFALAVMTYAYAGMFGVFCCALFTRRGNAWSVAAALVVGFVAVGVMQWGPKFLGTPTVGFAWYTPVGALLAFGVCVLGRRRPRGVAGDV